jgi:hypothetical protein
MRELDHKVFEMENEITFIYMTTEIYFINKIILYIFLKIKEFIQILIVSFRMTSERPGVVFVRQYANDPEVEVNLLIKRETVMLLVFPEQ